MKKHFLIRALSLCLTLCILCFSALVTTSALDTVPPDTDGKLTVKVNDSLMGIKLSLYDVGTFSYDTGEITLNDDFKDCEIPTNKLLDSGTARDVAVALSDYVLANSCDSVDTRIDENGNAVFNGLKTDYTVYLVVQASDFDFARIVPLLVVLPYRYEAGGDFQTDVTIAAKYVGDLEKLYKGAVIVNKTNDEANVLAGAEFKLDRKVYYTTEPKDIENYDIDSDEGGDFYWFTLSEDLITDEHGQIVVENLPFVTYRFVETAAPEGYILDETPHIFTVDKFGTVKTENDVYVPDEGDPIVIDVVNNKEEEPPVDSSMPSSSSSEPPVQSSVYSEPSTPSKVSAPSLTSIPTASVVSQVETSQSVWFEITGDELSKYIIIGAVVLASLAVVILLVVLSGKKKKK